MQTRSLLVVLGSTLLGLLPSPPVSADDVYLTNGRSFKGVIAEVGETQVKIHMPGGELGIPRSQVARVETSASDYAEYLRRKDEVRHAADRAGAWLDLALWAKAHGLPQSAREAALAAAEIDPQREDLAPLLRAAGYAFDPQLDRWIPYAEAMRRQGLVQAHAHGEWITREEYAAREQERREASERRAAAEADQTARARSEAVLRLAELQLARETIRAAQPDPLDYGYYGYGLPFTGYPGYVYIPPVVPFPPHKPPGHHHPHHPPMGPHPEPARKGYGALIGRQPGSLFPINAPPRSSSHH